MNITDKLALDQSLTNEGGFQNSEGIFIDFKNNSFLPIERIALKAFELCLPLEEFISYARSKSFSGKNINFILNKILKTDLKYVED